jgi:tetratricopeptide (TPR) repeat protein
MGAAAFNKGNYPLALSLFQSALKPPPSLGVDDFQFQSAPRAHYYIARTLEAMGRKEEAKAEYQESSRGVDLLSGDRDSWNSDNFYLVLSLEKLGMTEKAQSLIPHFDGFARTEMDEANRVHRGQARLLLGLIAKHDGQKEKALQFFTESLEALPDSLPPRYELRGDVLDPLVPRGSKTLSGN